MGGQEGIPVARTAGENVGREGRQNRLGPERGVLSQWGRSSRGGTKDRACRAEGPRSPEHPGAGWQERRGPHAGSDASKEAPVCSTTRVLTTCLSSRARHGVSPSPWR